MKSLYKEFVDARRKEFLDAFGGKRKWDNYRQVVWAVITAASEKTLTFREQEILLGVLSLRSFEDLAVEFSVSPQRVRNIFRLALRRVVAFRHLVNDEVAELKAKVRDLEAERDRLVNEVLRIHWENVESGPGIDNAMFLFCEPFTRMIKDCGFSVRLTNCLRSAEIATVGDLVSFPRTEYMRIRNLGRKTLDELDTFLAINNLSFAMWTNPDRPSMYD